MKSNGPFLGVFATVGQQVYKDGKNMWDNLVNVPQGIDRKDFQYLLKGPKYIGLTVYA